MSRDLTNSMQTREPYIPLPPLLGQAKEMAMGELHRRLAKEGFDQIRPMHGCVFRFVADEGSRLTELAERAGLTKQAVGEVVDDMQALGYVERAADPLDGRAKIIQLTDRGERARAAAMRIFAEIEGEWVRRFGKERIATVRDVLEELVLGGSSELAA
jgi:DNA-binding MarR family transcriptional regulator